MGSPDLPALLARVEAATGPDRALDSSLWAALGDRVGGTSDLDAWLRGDPIPPAEPVMGLTIAEALDRGVYGIAEAWRVPRFTTSIDATAALVEKLRPGTFITVWGPWEAGFDNGPWEAVIDNENWHGHGHTEPLARLAALLRSMIEEEEE